MTTILKFGKGQQYIYDRRDIVPPEVVEWMATHPECTIPDPDFHYGYHVFVFQDDASATEFKLRFGKAFGK